MMRDMESKQGNRESKQGGRVADAMRFVAEVYAVTVRELANAILPGSNGLPGTFVDVSGPGAPWTHDYDKRADYVLTEHRRELSRYAVRLAAEGGRFIALGRQLQDASRTIQRALQGDVQQD